jgi:hypothetical protein
MSSTIMLEAALQYAALGYPVFPLAPGSKLPLKGGHGLLDASTDPVVINSWWSEHPYSNIGLRTDGLIVIDVDGENNSWCNEESSRMDELLLAPTQITGNKGLQFFFRQPEGKDWHNTTGLLADHVDTRANGGYCVVPPSELAGAGKIYHWIKGHGLERAPEGLPVPQGFLLDALEALEGAGKGPRTNGAETDDIPTGQRNQTLFAMGSHLRRIGLLEPAIVAALLETNRLRCRPPLPAAEVLQTAHQAAQYVPDQFAKGAAEGVGAQFTIAEDDDDEDQRNEPPDPGLFPRALLQVPGLIGDVVKYNLETAIFPQPVLALAAALALMATITGRKIQDSRGTQTNLYVVGLCPSGGGKEHARKVNKALLERAGCPELIGPESIGSSAGLVTAVQEQPARLFQIDEIGRYLETMHDAGTSYLYNVITVLLKLFTSAGSLFVGDAYAESKRVKQIRWPHACLYGTTVPSSFYGGLSHKSLSDGFAARILVFETDHERPPKSTGVLFDPPQVIVDRITAWRKFEPGGNASCLNPQPVSLAYTTEAEDVFAVLEATCLQEARKANFELGTIWTRCEEKARKCALLWTASKDGIDACIVDAEAARWASDLCLYLTRFVLYASRAVADTEIESKTNLMLKMIRDSGTNGVTKKAIVWRFRSITRHMRDEIAQTLVDSGRVRMFVLRSGNRGRPPTVFVAREHVPPGVTGEEYR